MATLKANGGSLGVVDFGFKKKSIQANGTLLENVGNGWKVSGKIKQGLTPEFVLQKYRERAEVPALAVYRRALIDASGRLEVRHMIHITVSLLLGDPDGAWSELQDHWGIYEVSVEELCKINRSRESLERFIHEEKKGA